MRVPGEQELAVFILAEGFDKRNGDTGDRLAGLR